MLSSTYRELVEHRRAVNEALVARGMLPLAMDFDAALPGHDLISASLSKVDAADAYVGMISYRYGQIIEESDRNPDQLSLTELEFRRAVKRRIPICMFIMHDDHPVPRGAVGKEKGTEKKLEDFIALARKDRIYAEFTSVDDVKAKAAQSLVDLRRVLDRRDGVSGPGGEFWAARFISNVPINVPHHFLGRDDALSAIHDVLAQKDGRAAITALHGLRGVGKTTLAAAYAERHAKYYRATWWIRAQTGDTMRADLVGLSVRLGWVASNEKEEPALGTVMERLRNEGDGVLLIYDNAIDAD